MRTTAHEPAANGITHRFDKAFHVSPFMPMEQKYEWRFSEPAERLSVHMKSRTGGDAVFGASLSLRRHEITGASLAGALAAYPWMTARVATGIYWQALRLRLKGARYYDHPERATA